MSKFKLNEFQVKKDPTQNAPAKIVKVEHDIEQKIEPFEFSSLKSGSGTRGYQSVKSKFGAIASTDLDRKGRAQKDSRFSLHELVRGPLSVEEEEQRAIDEKVRQRIEALKEDARAKASEVGYQEGLKRGYDEAYRQFQEEGKGRLEALDSFLREAESAKEEIFRANERFLMEMVFKIGRMVLLRELTTDHEYVLRVARELIDRVGVRENITIRINPEQKETIAMLKDGLEKTLGVMKNLNIEASNQVRSGGCMVETEWNAIDASIDTQLHGIYQAMLGAGGSQS